MNFDAYRSDDVVDFYARKTDLYRPESAILERLRPELSGMRMLDVGVGGGRTTRHFAGLVKEYVGVDYAPEMVETCRKAFGEAPGKRSFRRIDATDMREFADGGFDLVLFSLNGIDSGPNEFRQKILSEARRVGRAGGWFCFSAHNLNHIKEHFRFHRTLRPLKLLREIRRQWGLRRTNPPLALLETQPHAMINDGAHDFRFSLFYVRPAEQLRQLAGFGFSDVEIYLLDGRKVAPEQALDHEESMWFYYLCRIRK